ncbi:MAG: hypothetical protein WB581_11035 [Halobacteriota archaeon]
MDGNMKSIEEAKIEITSYVKALHAVLCLRKFVREELQGEYYFGQPMHYVANGRNIITPDMFVQLPDSVWVGEIKRSLRNPKAYGTNEEYVKSEIEERLVNEQLKKYDKPLEELSRDHHDLVLFIPRDNYSAFRLHIKYFQAKQSENQQVFENIFALLSFGIDHGANNNIEFISIALEHGAFSNSEAVKKLEEIYTKRSDELADEIAQFKIYEEANNAPVEYIMSILWSEVFPEIIKKNSIQKIKEFKRDKRNVIQVSLNQLVEYFDHFTLPCIEGADRKQVTRSQLRTAMELFEQNLHSKNGQGENEPLVTRIENGSDTQQSLLPKIGDDSDISYKVIYKSLKEKQELESFLKMLYSDSQTSLGQY